MGALPPGVEDNSPDPQTAIDRKSVMSQAKPASLAATQANRQAIIAKAQADAAAARNASAARRKQYAINRQAGEALQAKARAGFEEMRRRSQAPMTKPGGTFQADIGKPGAFKKGGKVAAKAPVKKAVGGPVKAKAVARPVAKKAAPRGRR